MFSVKAGDAPAALRASVLAMRRADKFIRSDVSQRMRSTMNPVWQARVTAGVKGGMAARLILPGTRIAAGNPPALVAASSNRRIGNGLTPNKNAAGYEFGASDRMTTQKSGRGPNKSYKRHAMRHLPARNPKGYAVHPAAREVLPRVASFYAQTVIKVWMDAAEEGQS